MGGCTTRAKHDEPILQIRLPQNLFARAPNEFSGGNATYVRTSEGWLHLTPLIDVYSRKVVVYDVDDHMQTSLPLRALKKALNHRSPKLGLDMQRSFDVPRA
jgi:transposase InsO family protein